jgi:hypothetical protein
MQKLKITSMNISHTTLKYKLQEHYQNKIHEQLKNMNKSDCGKFAFYSKIVDQNEYKLQHYLMLPLKRKVLTKLRISILKRVYILNPQFPKKTISAVHVNCLLKMKNICIILFEVRTMQRAV